MHLDVGGRAVHEHHRRLRRVERARARVRVDGAANDHSVFALQSRYFAWHGMNVLAVDTPGHGRSEGDALPDVEAVTFPETGHALMAERPGDVLDALRRFL